MTVARSAAAVDGIRIGIRAVALAAVDEARLLTAAEAEDDRRVARLGGREAGEL